ncbi:MAG: OsmC family protein [Paracoccaceae bacterium]|nr:OsmC family protein [Paracoccaceae bacterium]
MRIHEATVKWTVSGDFPKGQYDRAHDWHFDGGAVVRGAASPANVPGPYTDASAVDPEEALVAAVAACHMLWFLDLARRAGLKVASYTDAARGRMTAGDRPWVDRIELSPEIAWEGDAPDEETLARLHHDAHENCFIANSIKSEVVVV